MTQDRTIRQYIGELVQQERTLRDGLSNTLDSDGSTRRLLQLIEVELDQCWDLLRQRAAAREFGRDPETATVRPASVVENYRS